MGQLIEIRKETNTSAVVFIHGFRGDADATWDRFPYLLKAERSLDSWDILTLGYSSSFFPRTKGIWESDPDLPKLAIEFLTELKMAPLSAYDNLAIVAHSMGGLIAERSVVDGTDILHKIKHLFLFGTPSAGIRKTSLAARLFGPFLGDQVRNMRPDSEFITKLRTDWRAAFGDDPPFDFLTIAGDKDQFVEAKSSLDPFTAKHQKVVVGDHLAIVKPKNEKTDAVRLLLSGLTDTSEQPGPASQLRRASELGNGAPEGVAIAQQGADGTRTFTTQEEVVDAALALDRAARRNDAVELLQRHRHLGTDVWGTLAGRIKRRWIMDGGEGDAYWALGLYEDALRTARGASDEKPYTIGQIFYLAINVAFLNQVAFSDPAKAKEMAALALEYARKLNPPDAWSVATEAEANLYLGNEEAALAKYREVLAMSPEKWKLVSTAQQAEQIACKLGNDPLQKKLDALFEAPLNKQTANA